MLSEVSSSITCVHRDTDEGVGLADSLRNELILYGIQTHLFLPATIFSPGFENEQILKPALCKTIEGPDEGMTPDQVAGKLIAGSSTSFL